MSSDDLLRHPMQIARAGVVAKACRDPQNVVDVATAKLEMSGKRAIQRSK